MGKPVMYRSEDEAVRAASSSISFETQSDDSSEHARMNATCESASENSANETLDSILKDMPETWR